MPAAARQGLLHATGLGWHDVFWGLGFIAAIGLVYWAAWAGLRRRKA